jgi:hypothetical protein
MAESHARLWLEVGKSVKWCFAAAVATEMIAGRANAIGRCGTQNTIDYRVPLWFDPERSIVFDIVADRHHRAH